MTTIIISETTCDASVSTSLHPMYRHSNLKVDLKEYKLFFLPRYCYNNCYVDNDTVTQITSNKVSYI